MSRGLSAIAVIGIWLQLNLIFLGSPELRSEEGHRVLPAVQILENANYIVPYSVQLLPAQASPW